MRTTINKVNKETEGGDCILRKRFLVDLPLTRQKGLPHAVILPATQTTFGTEKPLSAKVCSLALSIVKGK